MFVFLHQIDCKVLKKTIHHLKSTVESKQLLKHELVLDICSVKQ